MVLQVADSRTAAVQHEGVGFAGDDKSGVGLVIDLSQGQVKRAVAALTARCVVQEQQPELAQMQAASTQTKQPAQQIQAQQPPQTRRR